MASLRKHWLLVLLIFVNLLFIGLIFSRYVSSDKEVNQLKAQIGETQGRLSVLTQTQEKENRKVLKSAVGIDAERVVKDDAVMTDLMKQATSWSSYKTYMESRDQIMKDYGFAKDSSFMTVFMPEVLNEKLDGKNYNRIDTMGYNMSFKSLVSYPMAVTSKTYSYFALVTVSSTNKTVKTSADTKIAVTYEVTGDGKLVNVEAIPIHNEAGITFE